MPPPSGPAAAALQLRVTAMGGLGDGIARLADGQVVLIPATLPGDLVLATLGGRRQGVMRATLQSLISPSPERQQPLCSAFGSCGGCALQHWQLDAQREHKRQQLQRLMGPDGPLVALAALPSPAGQRRRARLHLRREGGRLQAAFLAAASDRLAPVADCTVLAPPLEALRRQLGPALQDWVDQGEVHAVLGREGLIAALTARPIAAPAARRARPRAPVVTARPLDQRHLGPSAAVLASQLGLAGWSARIGASAEGSAWSAAGSRADQWGLHEVTLPEIAATATGPVGDGPAGDGPLTVRVDAAGFCQASAAGNRAIRQAVAAALDSLGPFATAQEFYAGSGNLTGLLLQRGLAVRAVELDAAACGRLRRAVQQAGLGEAVEVVQADVAQALVPPRRSDDQPNDEVWLLDPGRMGAREVCSAAARWRPRAVVYVSCALDKLARDLQILRNGGLHPYSATLVDAFGWTVHAEAVVALGPAR